MGTNEKYRWHGPCPSLPVPSPQTDVMCIYMNFLWSHRPNLYAWKDAK